MQLLFSRTFHFTASSELREQYISIYAEIFLIVLHVSSVSSKNNLVLGMAIISLAIAGVWIFSCSFSDRSLVLVSLISSQGQTKKGVLFESRLGFLLSSSTAECSLTGPSRNCIFICDWKADCLAVLTCAKLAQINMHWLKKKTWTYSCLISKYGLFFPSSCAHIACFASSSTAKPSIYLLGSWRSVVLHLHEGPVQGHTTDWEIGKRRVEKKPSSQWGSQLGPLNP